MSAPIERVERICQGCGACFLFRPSPSRSDRGKFCSRSCGGKVNSTRHGHTTHTTQSKSYTSYRNMLARCYQPTNERYADYGGRGISVCERWKTSFSAFLEDMGERPDGMTLDRIDGDKDYAPGNCRWATAKSQQRNLKTNVWIEHAGQRLVLADWATQTGLDGQVISYRIRKGWSIEQALCTPARQKPSPPT